MKEAIARFNSWQCPVCKKFTPKPKLSETTGYNGKGDFGKCKSCGEELHFPIIQPNEEIIELREEVIEAGQTPGMPLGEALMKYLLYSEEEKKLEDIKKLTLRVVGMDNRYTLVNFTNRPFLFKFFKNWSEKSEKDKGEYLTLSEVIVGFAAKGVQQYIEEKKAKKETK